MKKLVKILMLVFVLSMTYGFITDNIEASLTLYCNKDKIRNDGKDEIILTVVDENKKDVTNECDFQLNSYIKIPSTFSIDVLGHYTAVAFKGKEKSNLINIRCGIGIYLADKTLEALVRQIIDKDLGDILDEDIQGLHTLIASGRGIVDLSGIQYLTVLTHLELDNNKIEEIKYLKNLKQLELLWIWKNNINNLLPLTYLENLKELEIWGNNIYTIPNIGQSGIGGFLSLGWLGIDKNHINDISPLEKVKNLKWLNITGDNITGEGSAETIKKLKARGCAVIKIG